MATLVSHAALAVSLTVEEEPIVLGRQDVVTLQIETRASSRGGALRVAVNVGHIEEIEEVGRGRYRALYRLPETRFPQVAIVGLWHETGDDGSEVTVFRIPLHGITRIPATTQPGTSVFVRVGGARFGPVRADGTGSAMVPITVAPGVRNAVVEARDEAGVQSRRRVSVEVPDYNRLLAVMVPERLSVGRGRYGRLEVHYIAPDPVSSERLRVEAEHGELTLVDEGDGRYVYRYDPPRVETYERVDVTVSVDGDTTSRATLGVAIDRPAQQAALDDLQLGVRLGITQSREMTGPRFAIDAWLPVSVDQVNLVVGASLGYGRGGLGPPSSRTTVHLWPLILRVGHALIHQGEVTAGVGVGASALYGYRRNEESGATGSGIGVGAHVYADAEFDVGAGVIFLEVGLGYAPIPTHGLQLQAGGIHLQAGFRTPVL